MSFLADTAIFGGALTLLVLVLRSQKTVIAATGIPVPAPLLHEKKIPYGIAIGIAAFVDFPSSPLMQFVLNGGVWS